MTSLKKKNDANGTECICKMSFASTWSEVKRVTFVLLILTFIHIGWLFFSRLKCYISEETVNTYRWYHYPSGCQIPPEARQDLIHLTASSLQALNDLSISAPVCYGTLWGLLRRESIALPWDNNVDFCVMNTQLMNVSFNDLQAAFRKRGVYLSPFDWNTGSHAISKGKAKGAINLFFDCSSLFYATHPEYPKHSKPGLPRPLPEKPHWACPMGLSPTFVRWFHDLNKPFPSWLLEPPFSTQVVDGVNVSVPNDGMEIQKYFYPDDWWLEAKPPGC